MKKNDPKRRQRYHQYLLRNEEEEAQKQDDQHTRKQIKEAISSLDQDLNLSDTSDVEMQVPGVSKVITRKRSHVKTMKKKVRKWKKEPIPTDAEMEEDS